MPDNIIVIHDIAEHWIGLLAREISLDRRTEEKKLSQIREAICKTLTKASHPKIVDFITG